jgi:pseudouridine synthase
VRERLQKLIARAGITSRRHAEELIQAGQVTVNGEIVSELGSKADPDTDSIKVSGKLLRFPEQKIYIVLNKPSQCVATMSDPEGRNSLRKYLHGIPGRVFTVGRLDYPTEGLLLLTNDGDFAHRLMKISRRMWQTYWFKTKGALSPQEVQDTERFLRTRLNRLQGRGGAANPWYSVTLTEARSDLLRPFLARMGHPVEKFRRVKLANLDIGSLGPGEHRSVAPDEMRDLRRAVESASSASKFQNDTEGSELPSEEAKRRNFTAETRRTQRMRREHQSYGKRQSR